MLNQGERAANLSTVAQMSLKDSEERRYTVDLMAGMALGGAAPEGGLAVGETVRGPIGFQVPSDAGGLTFVFDGGLFTSGKAFIALGDEPVTVERPAADLRVKLLHTGAGAPRWPDILRSGAGYGHVRPECHLAPPRPPAARTPPTAR